MSDIPALAEQAFHGLIGRIVRKIAPQTESDPAALLLQLLVGFGNACGRHSYFQHEADRHFTNLYLAMVGPSSKGRKGTSLGHVRRVLKKAFPDWSASRIKSGIGSGEGLIDAVRDPLVSKATNDLGEKIERVEDPGEDDKRLLAIETEFAGMLRRIERDGSTLSAVVRDAWDRGELSTLTRANRATASGTHVSIVGHITEEELVRLLSESEIANGFGNRFQWLVVERVRLLPHGGDVESVDLSAEIEALRRAAEFAGEDRRLWWSERAAELWTEVYPELSSGAPGIVGSLISRAEAQVTRLALIYALLDLSAEIRQEHLLAALAVWERCRWSVEMVFGGGTGDPIADRLLRILRDAPDGRTSTQLTRALGNNVSARRRDEALELLQSDKAIERVADEGSGSGRPREVWRIVR